MRALILLLALAAGGCNPGFAPATYVEGLRVFAVKAEPPEVAPGETTTMTLLAVDTAGRPVAASWSACLIPAGTTTAVNPECVTAAAGAGFLPLGDGLTATLTMPALSPLELGLPDATAGFYLPVRIDVTAAGALVPAIYRVRYSLGLTPPNHNPALAGLWLVEGAKNSTTAALTPLDEAAPPTVHVGDRLVLRGAFTADSAETYPVPAGDPRLGQTKEATEILRLFWYATAGDISDEVTGGDQPDTVLSFDQRLPDLAGGSATIDVWLVGREERGGTDWVHRTIVLAP
jgi:hypothetical protein